MAACPTENYVSHYCAVQDEIYAEYVKYVLIKYASYATKFGKHSILRCFLTLYAVYLDTMLIAIQLISIRGRKKIIILDI